MFMLWHVKQMLRERGRAASYSGRNSILILFMLSVVFDISLDLRRRNLSLDAADNWYEGFSICILSLTNHHPNTEEK